MKVTIQIMKADQSTRPEVFLGQITFIKVDRPMGSQHPEWSFIYPVNYGFVPDVIAPDGEELDDYVLGVFEPVDVFERRCIAVIHRREDEDPKLVIVKEAVRYSDEQILSMGDFQEGIFNTLIVRGAG